MKPQTPKDRLIVALDVAPDEGQRLVGSLRETVGLFKIGSHLFTTAGPEFVRGVVDSGARVFLDLKFHDIPHQVSLAASVATELGVSMFTLHASGGSEMMKKAVEAVSETAARRNLPRPIVLAVTVLTSMNAESLEQIGMAPNTTDAVVKLMTLAESSGVDGIVASPQEIEVIRANSKNKDLLIVTPGIRPTSTVADKSDDQKRVATPAAAIRAGADYLVVGRPITSAAHPTNAVNEIIAEMSREA